jgi:hypothetical protein
LTTSPKSSQASRSKTELKPLKLARSQHDRKASNTRFDNNSKACAQSTGLESTWYLFESKELTIESILYG